MAAVARSDLNAPPERSINEDRLGTGGADWEAYLDKDPKLFVQSEAILDSALQSLVDSQVRWG